MTNGQDSSNNQSNSPQLIHLWQLSDSSRMPNLPLDSGPTPNLDYFTLAFTPNGSLRAMGQNLNEIQLDTWDIRSGKRIERITQLPGIDRQDHLGLLSPDGIWYFVRSDVVGTRLINTQLDSVLSLGGIAQQALFSSKGDHLAIATNETVQIFSQASLQR